jgi:tRNA threonylcarbamoyladenosine biosynthesis protein TsaB
LALDSAGDTGSVAARTDAGAVTTVRFGHRRHAAELTPSVHRALADLDAAMPDVARVIISDGPGSFTGLRIGFATAVGLVHARPAIETWVAPALMATAFAAHNSAPGEPIAALYDALRGDVYGALYRFRDAHVEVLQSPVCATVAALVASWSVRPAIAVGEGAQRYADQVRQWSARRAIDDGDDARALALLELLQWEGAATRVADLASYEPVYGRPAEAQVRWERARGRPLPHS